jgi:hypothetical protein
MRRRLISGSRAEGDKERRNRCGVKELAQFETTPEKRRPPGIEECLLSATALNLKRMVKTVES